MTDAMAVGRFPADEPLNDTGRRQVDDVAAGPVHRALCGPEIRVRQTAQCLGLHPEVEPALADLDCGRWRGEILDDVSPADVTTWLTDPTSAPHGGESIVELVARVRHWMTSLTAEHTRIVAVSHPAVVRAAVLVALDAPPNSFWRIDVAPVSRTVMHFRGAAWTLRFTQ